MVHLKEIVLDIESTGLDFKQGDKIIEIGCIELIDKIKTNNYFHTYINPKKIISQGAYKIHGISNEFLKKEPLFSDIAQKFYSFIENSRLVIHNANFDMGFINNEFQLVGMKKISMSNVIDTLKIARKKFPGSAVNLNALCKRFNISLDMRTKHGALIDAELLAIVYKELMSAEQTKFDFRSSISDNTKYTVTADTFPKRTFVLSDSEYQLHNQMLKDISKPLWKSII